LKAGQATIAYLESLLKSEKKMMEVIKGEIKDVGEKYGDDRRTKIVKRGAQILSAEDLVADEDFALVLTQGGYIKRTNPAEYRRQKRGGVGVVDLDTKEEDFVTHILTASAHSDILFFTDKGKAYQIKMYELPEGKRATKGKSIMNFLSLEGDEKVTSILPMPKETKAAEGMSLLLATKDGTVKKTSAAAFKEVRRSGLLAIGLDKGDSLISANFVHKGDTVFLVTTKGQSIRFDEKDVREMGRQAAGVRGIKLSSGDAIVGAGVAQKGGSEELLVLSQLGYGKKTPIKEYKVQGRGGSGIKTSAVTAKTGPVIAGLIVGEHGELIAMSQKSQVIRTDLAEIRSSGRQTQGVRVMTLRAGDKIAACVVLEGNEE